MLRPIALLADAEVEELLFDNSPSSAPARRMELELQEPGMLERLVSALLALRGIGRFIEPRAH